MAEKNYRVGEAIEIVYQAPNKESGLSNVVANILLPDDHPDSNFPDVDLIEKGTTGIYKGEFTPDEAGEWKAVCHKSDGDGQVVKRYSVGSHNVHSVGEAIADVDSDVAAVAGVVTALPDAAGVNAQVDAALADYDGPTKAELDAAHTTTDVKVDAVDAKAASIETKVDDIVTQVGSLDTPPMVS